MNKYSITIIISFIFSMSVSAKGYLKYSSAADYFSIVDSLSDFNAGKKNELGKNWIVSNKLSLEDKNHLNSFFEIRNRFKKSNSEFDRFSISFYRAKSIDEAMKNLKKVLKKEKLKKIVSVFRHFKSNASKILSESIEFRGKVSQLEKSLKKNKVYKTYENGFKYFGLKKSYKAKVFFLWWPKGKSPKVEIIQNIVFIKIHPQSNLSEVINSRFILDQMMSSLFTSISPTQKQNFEKTILESCEKDLIYPVLTFAMGELSYQRLRMKKKFDPFVDNLKSKKANSLAIMLEHLYQLELKSKRKFYGEFANKVKFVCSQS